jgi:antitoxin (DNA-binding transcriptional repressor) of toxin-antitoxin stability system
VAPVRRRHLALVEEAVARLIPFQVRTEPRRPGLWRGKVRVAPDFDAPDDELIDAFEG